VLIPIQFRAIASTRYLGEISPPRFSALAFSIRERDGVKGYNPIMTLPDPKHSTLFRESEGIEKVECVSDALNSDNARFGVQRRIERFFSHARTPFHHS
jgi:hypothetical protein